MTFYDDLVKMAVRVAPHTNYSDSSITDKDQKLQTVDKFTYFRSTVSSNVIIDDEVDARIAKQAQLSEGFDTISKQC